MEKPTCLCGKEMTFLMDNKRHVIWECQNCGRLLLRPKQADWQRWYFPEAGLKEGWDKPNYATPEQYLTPDQ
jgi:hypothetical protein